MQSSYEIWDNLKSLLDLNPSKILINKSYNYFCVERNEKLQSYEILIKINNDISSRILLMSGNEVYLDEVICDIFYKNENIYSGNLSLDELISKLKNIDKLK